MGRLSGMSVGHVGTYEICSETQFINMVVAEGGVFQNTLSRLDLLVVGSDPGDKAFRTSQTNPCCLIMTEDAFKKTILQGLKLASDINYPKPKSKPKPKQPASYGDF